ncbi:MAG: response regulator [Planctomycetes bacterium]|nr:response regulator [Planctomycetota bacterium]
MAVGLEQLADSLLRAGLLTDTEFESACTDLSAAGESITSDRLLDHLTGRGRLTEFQRRRVAEGRSGELVFGNYVILNRIGEGGMGQVFKALHRRMKRVVAVKVIHRKLATPDFTARFRREIQAAARLNHPHVVAAYDADECELGDFLVMEFVEGADLKQIVEKAGPLAVSEAIEAIRQSAQALGYAHQQGLVHRDIKPANLMRDLSGSIKVADLGLARLIEENNGLSDGESSRTGAIAGTIDYMAPEQSLDSSSVDGRADIYSLGCTLFFLLTGRPVFERPSILARLQALRSEAPPSLFEVAEAVPRELDAIFQRMLAKSPEDRYQRMTEVVTALDQLERGRAPSAPVDDSLAETTVLLVEQSRLQGAMVSKMLHQIGISEIHVCPSGHEALESLSVVPAKLVILSLQLSDMSGLMLVERIRDELRWSRVAVLVMTSDELSESLIEALGHFGKTGLLRKPFDAAELGAAIRALMNSEFTMKPSLTGFASKRILIVDDSGLARRRMQETLADLGFVHFTAVADGTAAVDCLKRERFDMIVTDYNMPEMNGKDLVAWIRQKSDQRTVPIVMVTTEFDPSILAGVYQLGVSAICGKSFDMEMVRHIVIRLFA